MVRTRTSLGLAVVASLLCLPGIARASEPSGPGTVVVVHDVSDLAASLPDLAASLDDLVPDAQIRAAGRGQLIVSAPGGLQEDVGLLLAALRRDLIAPGDAVGPEAVAKRALERARAGAATLARLRDKKLKGRFEAASGDQALVMLATVSGVSVVASQAAHARLEALDLHVRAEEISVRGLLDLLLQGSDLGLALDAGVVRVVTAKELAPDPFHVDFSEVIVPTEEEGEEAADGEDAPAKDETADLQTLVRALHEEVRALREEVREVRAILEEMQSR